MKKFILTTILTLSTLAATYIGGWFYMEHKMNQAIDQFYNATGPAMGIAFLGNRPQVYGFPGVPVIVYKKGFKTNNINFVFSKVKITGYPIPYFPLNVKYKSGFHYWENNSKTWASLKDVNLTIKMPTSLPKSVSKFHLKEWQKNVGTIDIKNLSLTAEEVALTAFGTIGLDNDLQPICALKSKVYYYDKIINFLTKAGKITPLAGAIAISTLNAMAEEKEEVPGVKAVKLDIKIEDQELYVGPIKVIDIPTVDWK